VEQEPRHDGHLRVTEHDHCATSQRRTDFVQYSCQINQIKFVEQQLAESHWQVAKTMIETINTAYNTFKTLKP